MKTSKSVPDDVFEGTRQLARRKRRSRNETHEITGALDSVLDDVRMTTDPMVDRAARRTLENSEW
jgi:hypothetical protein